MHVPVFEYLFFISFRYIPRNRMAGSYDTPMFNFLNYCQIVPVSDLFTSSPAMYENSQFSHILGNPCYSFFWCVILVHVKWCVLWFDLRFLDDEWCWASCHMIVGYMSFLEKHLEFFVSLKITLSIWVMGILFRFWLLKSYQIMICIYSPILLLVSYSCHVLFANTSEYTLRLLPSVLYKR